MVHILSDSCSDLSPDLRARYQIDTIPLYITLNDKSYRDGEELTCEDIFESVKETGKLPKTAAPSIIDFERFFASHPGDIVFMSIGSKLSATHQTARLASQQMPARCINIVDSCNLSTGIGLLALAAADLRDHGYGADEIASRVEAIIPKVRTSFIIDTLDYLYRGGRCSAMQSIIGSLLQIRPVIEMKPDGTLGIKEKTRGSRKKTLAILLHNFEAHLEELDLRRVFVTHTGCDDDALYVKEAILKMASIEEIFITYAGATVSSHCGPNTLGLIYRVK
jgi:DegV family protein with EDD domain